MRFVFGIAIGGILGLLSCTDAMPQWVPALGHFRQATPEALESRPAERFRSARESGAMVAAGVTNSVQSKPQGVDGEKPVSAMVDGPDVQQALPETGEADTPEPGSDERTGVASNNDHHLAIPIGEAHGATHQQYQSAWSVFRSQTSARGFAAWMSKDLARDFEVVKLGPGRYEVRFHWAVPEDRRSVLDAIAALTGFRPLEDDHSASL